MNRPQAHFVRGPRGDGCRGSESAGADLDATTSSRASRVVRQCLLTVGRH